MKSEFEKTEEYVNIFGYGGIEIYKSISFYTIIREKDLNTYLN
jgi:hypothetical protein